MKNRKRFLALFLSAVMTVTPISGVYASDISEAVTEAAKETTSEKSGERPAETATEKDNERPAEIEAEKISEKPVEKTTETITEETAEKIGETSEKGIECTETETEFSETAESTESDAADGSMEAAEETAETAETVSESQKETAVLETETNETAVSQEEVSEPVPDTEITDTEKKKKEEVFSADEISVVHRGEKLEVTLYTKRKNCTKIYIGKKEDDIKAPEYTGIKEEQGYKFVFELPAEMLGQKVCVVPYDSEEEEWYTAEDIIFMVPAEAPLPETMPLEMEAAEKANEEMTVLVANAVVNDKEYADGDYKFEVTSSFPMFSIIKSSAKVSDGKVIVTIETGKNTYDKIYLGSKDDEDKSSYIQGIKKEEDGYIFTFETAVSMMGQEVNFVPGKADGSWYIKNQYTLKIPEDLGYMDGNYSVAVESSFPMFAITESSACVSNGEVIVTIGTQKNTYDKIYFGNKDDTEKTPYVQGIKKENADGYIFTFAVSNSMMGQAVNFVPGKPDGSWYVKNQYTMTIPTVMKKLDGIGEEETETETEKEDISDGEYSAEVETGETMFRVVSCILVKKDGVMMAQVSLSGTGYDKLYMGSAVDAAKAPEAELIGYTVNSEGKYTYTIPVAALDTPIAVAAHSVKNGSWYDRSMTFVSATLEKIEGETGETESESEKETEPESEVAGEPDSSTSPVDNSTGLADGTYTPESFTFSGGTGKTTITCQKILVKNGKTYAVIQFSSSSYDYVKAGGYKYSKTNTSGNSTFMIPVKLNADNTVIGNTMAMGTPHEITYTIYPVLSETAQTEKETEKQTETERQTETEKETEPAVPADPAKLQNGDYSVNVYSSASMFRVIQCILTYKDGVMTAKITLSGTGYDKLFMGTSAAAAKAGASKMIGYAVNNDGKYVFEVPVSALDTAIDVAAHSVKNDKWYDRQLIFRTIGMTLISAENSEPSKETEKTTESETETKNDKNPDKESTYEKDLSGSTGAVDSSTSLPDGVYTPDKFSWSGGSGRVSISCSKITVSGGQAFATIVFSSDSYAYVKANGNKYTGTVSGGTTSFVIPVKLNANNTIIGMTTKMSAAHEITYNIYIYLKAADSTAGKNGSGNGMDSEAPEIAGLQYQSETKLEHAKYFKIYNYSDGIKLLEVDMMADTAREAVDDTDAEKGNVEAAEEDIALPEAMDGESVSEETAAEQVQTSEEIIAELYKSDAVKYLIVPENVEIPVGLEKEMIIVNLPVEKVYAASEEAMEMMEKLEAEKLLSVSGLTGEQFTAQWYKEALAQGTIADAGSWTDLEFAVLVKNRCDLALFPAEFLPGEKDTVREDTEYFEQITSGFATLGIPLVVDRSSDEESELAQAEWIKVYGVLLGCEAQADVLYTETVDKTA